MKKSWSETERSRYSYRRKSYGQVLGSRTIHLIQSHLENPCPLFGMADDELAVSEFERIMKIKASKPCVLTVL